MEINSIVPIPNYLLDTMTKIAYRSLVVERTGSTSAFAKFVRHLGAARETSSSQKGIRGRATPMSQGPSYAAYNPTTVPLGPEFEGRVEVEDIYRSHYEEEDGRHICESTAA